MSWRQNDTSTDLEEALHVAGRVFWSGPIVAVRQQDHHPTLQQPFRFTWGQSFKCMKIQNASKMSDNVSLILDVWEWSEVYLQRWTCQRWSVLRWRNLQTEPPRWEEALVVRCSYHIQTRAPPPQTEGCYTPEDTQNSTICNLKGSNLIIDVRHVPEILRKIPGWASTSTQI